MNYRLLIKVISILLLIIAGFMIFPIICALYYGENFLLESFLIPMAAVIIFFTAIHFLTGKLKNKTLSTKDGISSGNFQLDFSLSGRSPAILSVGIYSLYC